MLLNAVDDWLVPKRGWKERHRLQCGFSACFPLPVFNLSALIVQSTAVWLTSNAKHVTDTHLALLILCHYLSLAASALPTGGNSVVTSSQSDCLFKRRRSQFRKRPTTFHLWFQGWEKHLFLACLEPLAYHRGAHPDTCLFTLSLSASLLTMNSLLRRPTYPRGIGTA